MHRSKHLCVNFWITCWIWALWASCAIICCILSWLWVVNCQKSTKKESTSHHQKTKLQVSSSFLLAALRNMWPARTCAMMESAVVQQPLSEAASSAAVLNVRWADVYISLIQYFSNRHMKLSIQFCWMRWLNLVRALFFWKLKLPFWNSWRARSKWLFEW